MAEKAAKEKHPAPAASEKTKAAKKAAAEGKAAKAAGPGLALSDGREVKHPVPRLKKLYAETVVPALMQKRGLGNIWACPRLTKIVVNVGVSEARENVQVIDGARAEIALITGQWPQLRRAHKSISNFKLREGMPIGLRVTLRGDRMYEFLDRLVSVAIPRIRDFRGLEPRGFDGNGNFNLGLREQMIFPEIDLEKTTQQRGMNITFVTTAGKDDLSQELLQALGMPFKAAPAPREAAAAAAGGN